jgi:TonB family protein
MDCKEFGKRVIPFMLALTVGVVAVAVFSGKALTVVREENSKNVNKIKALNAGNGRAAAACDGKSDFEKESAKEPRVVSGIKIISKPRAEYTEEARFNQVQGKVVLRVTFTASGKIGGIFPVKELPDGLTEQAIAAARQIEFKPATRDGVPMSVSKPVEYTFTIY